MSFIIERNSLFCSVAGIVSSRESISERLAEFRAASVGAFAFIVASSRVAASSFVATSICTGDCAWFCVVLLLIMCPVGSSAMAGIDGGSAGRAVVEQGAGGGRAGAW